MAAQSATYIWTLLGPRARIEYMIFFEPSVEEARAKAIRLAELDDNRERSAR